MECSVNRTKIESCSQGLYEVMYTLKNVIYLPGPGYPVQLCSFHLGMDQVCESVYPQQTLFALISGHSSDVCWDPFGLFGSFTILGTAYFLFINILW
jgi:hypothetical protein